MEEKLTKLYNTLMTIETKGENTKVMAVCLNYTAGLIDEARTAKAEAKPVNKEGD